GRAHSASQECMIGPLPFERMVFPAFTIILISWRTLWPKRNVNAEIGAFGAHMRRRQSMEKAKPSKKASDVNVDPNPRLTGAEKESYGDRSLRAYWNCRRQVSSTP